MVTVSVELVKSILGISNPPFMEVISKIEEASGEAVPIPTCALTWNVKNKMNIENKNDFMVL